MSMPRTTLRWGSAYGLGLGVSQNYIVSGGKHDRCVSEEISKHQMNVERWAHQYTGDNASCPMGRLPAYLHVFTLE